jgi:Cu/Zn superoxide dismutase
MVKSAKVVVLLVLVAVMGIAAVSVASAQTSVTMYTQLGWSVGSAMLTATDDGTEVQISLAGLEDVASDKRVAITSNGSCGDGDFSAAGNDLQALPNLQLYEGGIADYKYVVDGVDLDALADADGSAIVIYADAGDNPGERILCGVIAAGPSAEPEATEEATPEATEEATPEATEEATPVATEEATPEATVEATVEATEEPVDEDRTLVDALNEGYGAILRDVQGREVAYALMIENNDGDAEMILSVVAMEDAPGDKRVALTATNQCNAPDYSSAGDEVQQLPNIQFFEGGEGDYGRLVEGLDLDQFNDADGSALVVYADAGENPGDRILCGALVGAPAVLDYFGLTVEEYVFILELIAGAQ